MNEYIEIPELRKQFYDHLTKNDNQKIILSGKFGIGKTHFLYEFFKEYNEQFTFAYLSPIHYSIAPNEDVLTYLKYDILYDLVIRYETEVKGIDQLDLKQYLPDWYISLFLSPYSESQAQGEDLNQLPWLNALLPFIGKVGKELGGIVKSLAPLLEIMVKEAKEADVIKLKGISPENYIHRQLKSNASGLSLYDHDLFLAIIKELLEKVHIQKTKDLSHDKGKGKVLILDDLDRLDPEHVFRILNVFAAYSDFQLLKKQENDTDHPFHYAYHGPQLLGETGFDKIILVCDIKNIRSIFQHRFGLKADFEGYLSKFYSKSLFEFENRNAIQAFFKKVVEKHFALDEKFLDIFFEILLDRKIINIRQLVKLVRDIDESKYYSGKDFKLKLAFEDGNGQIKDIQLVSNQVYTWDLIKVLHILFGHKDELVNILEKIHALPKEMLMQTIREDDMKALYEIFSLGNCLLLLNNQKLSIKKKPMDDISTKSFFEIAVTDLSLGYGSSPKISVLHKLELGARNTYISHRSDLLKNKNQSLGGNNLIKIDFKWFIDQLLKMITLLEKKRITNKLLHESK